MVRYFLDKRESWQCMLNLFYTSKWNLRLNQNKEHLVTLFYPHQWTGSRKYTKLDYCSKCWQWSYLQNVCTVIKPAKQELDYLLQSLYNYFIDTIKNRPQDKSVSVTENLDFKSIVISVFKIEWSTTFTRFNVRYYNEYV